MIFLVRDSRDDSLKRFTISEYDRFIATYSLEKSKMRKTCKKLYEGNDGRNWHKGFRLEDIIDENLEQELEKSSRLGGIVTIEEAIKDFNCMNVDNKEDSIMIISDLHAPFTHKDYLNFCVKMRDKYNIKNTVIIGDLLDNHYSSYHETDPNGMGADDELEKAKDILKGFYKEFPNAKITVGNHDRIILRKAFTSGLSKQWIKDIKLVLDTPNWEFREHFIINNRLYYHGEGMTPKAKCKEEMMSCICGHNHSQSYVEFFQNRQGKRIFAMQVGTGINQDAYAFAYNKFGRPSHINVGIIYNGIPIIEYMEV